MTNLFKERAPHFILATTFFMASCAPIETTTATPAPQVPTAAPTTQSNAPVNAALANEAIQIAGVLGGLRDQNLGSLRVTNIRTEGSTVIIESQIVTRRTRVEQSSARRQLRGFVCETPALKQFVDRGGALRFDIENRSGGGTTAITISSC